MTKTNVTNLRIGSLQFRANLNANHSANHSRYQSAKRAQLVTPVLSGRLMYVVPLIILRQWRICVYGAYTFQNLYNYFIDLLFKLQIIAHSLIWFLYTGSKSTR